jgi:hypothetical protein
MIKLGTSLTDDTQKSVSPVKGLAIAAMRDTSNASKQSSMSSIQAVQIPFRRNSSAVKGRNTPSDAFSQSSQHTRPSKLSRVEYTSNQDLLTQFFALKENMRALQEESKSAVRKCTRHEDSKDKYFDSYYINL